MDIYLDASRLGIYPPLFTSPSGDSCIIFVQFHSLVFNLKLLAPVVQKVDNAIHRINHYPLDIAIGFAITYPVDSDLSGG